MHPHNTGHWGVQLKLWRSFAGPAGSWPAELLASGQKEPKEISGDGQSCPNTKWRRLHSPYLQGDWNNLISENGYTEKQPAFAVCSSKLWQKHCILLQFLEAVLLGIKKDCPALPQSCLAKPDCHSLSAHTGILICYQGIRKWSGFQPQLVPARWGFLTAFPSWLSVILQWTKGSNLAADYSLIKYCTLNSQLSLSHTEISHLYQ